MNNTPCYPQHVRDDLCFRELTMLRVERINVGLQHIVLSGETLDGSTSRGFDGHSELFFPQPDAHFVPPTVIEEDIVWSEGPRPPSRDYTPLYDELRHGLVIDFFIHNGGTTGGWAIQAQPGDKLAVADSHGSLVVPGGYTYQLYVCGEPRMPALRHRLETLSKLAAKLQVSILVSVRDNACQDYLAHLDGFNIEWLAHDEWAVGARLAQMQILAGDYFIWIAGGGRVVKSSSRRFEAGQYDLQRVRAAAHWYAK